MAVSDGVEDRVAELELIVEALQTKSNYQREQIERQAERIEQLEQAVENGSDTAVSGPSARDIMLPIHTMLLDLKAGRDGQIPSNNARRGARLFSHLFRRAAGENDARASVTKKAYVMDSNQARAVLTDADDITDGGVSKTVARAMRAVQQFTKVSDCECGSISECDHGLVIFDDTRGTNRLRVKKDDLNTYGERVQAARTADDDGEQPSEAITTAEGNGSPEAVDAEFDALDGASPVTGQSDTVVSSIESKASDRPLIPDRPSD